MSEEKPTALVLDLDGTLLGTDSLWELFFKALSQGRWAPLLWLFCGRLFLKRKLAETTWLDLDLLPWNPGVIRLAQEYHEKGGQVWLATAANQAMAKKVYERFDFFTGYLASDEKINLRSAAKAKALVKLFGQGGYIYAGDSGADPPVWRDSGGAVVVGDEKRAQTAKPLDGEVMIIDPVGTKRPSLKMIFELAQPQNCLQNLLVFVPLLMSRLFYPENFGLAFLALLGFSFITMGGNVLGELYAVEKNRQDLAKKNGTLAAGRLDLSRAGFISLGFMLAALILFTFLGRITFKLILPLLILTYLNEHIFKKNHLAWCLAFAFINALVLA
ncbi:MAG: hypothetical protein LBE80_04810, partial [Deltaproteobacteria bacterium]|nr:hypothetical protein [Deltaproteobacteria bacterium]